MQAGFDLREHGAFPPLSHYDQMSMEEFLSDIGVTPVEQAFPFCGNDQYIPFAGTERDLSLGQAADLQRTFTEMPQPVLESSVFRATVAESLARKRAKLLCSRAPDVVEMRTQGQGANDTVARLAEHPPVNNAAMLAAYPDPACMPPLVAQPHQQAVYTPAAFPVFEPTVEGVYALYSAMTQRFAEAACALTEAGDSPDTMRAKYELLAGIVRMGEGPRELLAAIAAANSPGPNQEGQENFVPDLADPLPESVSASSEDEAAPVDVAPRHQRRRRQPTLADRDIIQSQRLPARRSHAEMAAVLVAPPPVFAPEPPPVVAVAPRAIYDVFADDEDQEYGGSLSLATTNITAAAARPIEDDPGCPINNLPSELWAVLFYFLGAQGTAQLAKTSRNMRQFVINCAPTSLRTTLLIAPNRTSANVRMGLLLQRFPSVDTIEISIPRLWGVQSYWSSVRELIHSAVARNPQTTIRISGSVLLGSNDPDCTPALGVRFLEIIRPTNVDLPYGCIASLINLDTLQKLTICGTIPLGNPSAYLPGVISFCDHPLSTLREIVIMNDHQMIVRNGARRMRIVYSQMDELSEYAPLAFSTYCKMPPSVRKSDIVVRLPDNMKDEFISSVAREIQSNLTSPAQFVAHSATQACAIRSLFVCLMPERACADSKLLIEKPDGQLVQYWMCQAEASQPE